MDPVTVLALVKTCILGLEKIHEYSSEYQRAELKVLGLAAECGMVEEAIGKMGGLYSANRSASGDGIEEVNRTLANCERQFRVLLDKLQPVLALVDNPNPSKRRIRLRITATWKRDEIDDFRKSIHGLAITATFMLQTVSQGSNNEILETNREILGILRSKEFRQLLKKSDDETESLSVAYDQESKLYRARRSDHDARAESIIDDKEFPFDGELFTGRAYRDVYPRWKRPQFISDRDQLEGSGHTSQSPSPSPSPSFRTAEGPRSASLPPLPSPSFKTAEGSRSVSPLPLPLPSPSLSFKTTESKGKTPNSYLPAEEGSSEDGLDGTDQVESYEEALPKVSSDVVHAKDVNNVIKKFQGWYGQRIDIWVCSSSYSSNPSELLEAKVKRADAVYSEICADVEAWSRGSGMSEEELDTVDYLRQTLAEIQELKAWPQ
ncbi:hypothetical protein B0T24DRAFT_719725 [Lasiosphaeria ovina]|uniref:Fungal N-terminal domain-containing protein n=1 Tax=Lasiosphaeria ovina TaxID=92902 RepID=A0AAE0KBM4_9PEZI|nr:hypothetical protein B0T24DRAFT_719725 [Lasiosphaeria ovina]